MHCSFRIFPVLISSFNNFLNLWVCEIECTVKGGKAVKIWQFSNCSLPINAMKTSWERVFVLKTSCDWSNCYVTYFYFRVRPYPFVVFYLFLLKIKEKSHKVVSTVARNYLICSIL